MIIGIDASRANKSNKTGVEWYSYYLIETMKKNPLRKGDRFVLYSAEKLKGNLNIMPDGWQSKVLAWPFKYFWTQIRLCFEMIFNPPDVLFVPAHALPFFCRTRTVITIHDLGFERFPQAYTFWQRFYTRLTYRRAVRSADKVLVPSEFTKKELIELYRAQAQKIFVTPLSYEPNIFQPAQEQEKINLILQQYKITEPYILYVGRLEKKKNINNLLTAFRILKNRPKTDHLKLVLVGNPAFGYQKEINPDIIEINYLTPQDLRYLYNGAVCFVFPSLYEGFGLPVLEAMACGCPVICSSVASLPEVAGAAALYCSPDMPIDIADKITKIIIEPELRKDLVNKGFEQIKRFSWQQCADKTLQALLNI